MARLILFIVDLSLNGFSHLSLYVYKAKIKAQHVKISKTKLSNVDHGKVYRVCVSTEIDNRNTELPCLFSL